MKHSVTHNLSFDVAKKVAAKALESYQERFADYAPSITWPADRRAEVSFAVKGMTLKGGFDILDDRIDIEMEVPLLLRPFRQKALDVIEAEITKWVAKAKSGEI
ncbi:MAG: polyhydroxyalkanoic acid system family protein [Deltaproteobacteria bacterium]|nr:polyhydroxyalkanoic acid system family protein [Deltaproteobacteria bacterium]